MERKYPHLYSPYKIGNYTFKNRLVAAPVGSWIFSPRNYIVDYAISTYEDKARGGAAALPTQLSIEKRVTVAGNLAAVSGLSE